MEGSEQLLLSMLFRLVGKMDRITLYHWEEAILVTPTIFCLFLITELIA
jgi:hypothetical protein